ncbi:MAG: transglutaminase domain-containing protein [Thermodesulfobacteriota bacterium]
MKSGRAGLPVLLLALGLLACGCGLPQPQPVAPAPPDAAFLVGGAQSRPTADLEALVRDLAPGAPAEERLAALLRRVTEIFAFDPWQNEAQLGATATELAGRRFLGGCGAYALVELGLIRAMGLPARLVLTADADWIVRYREAGLSMPSGHAFIEVWSQGRWLLLDPTFFILFDGHRPDRPFYPRRQVFVARGLDFWDLGLQDTALLLDLYEAASRVAPLPWQDPELSAIFTLAIDPPAILTAAAQRFLEERRFPEAEERLAKALRQDPAYRPALVLRGRLAFLRQDYAAALDDFEAVVTAAPREPDGYVWRAHAQDSLGRRDLMCRDLAQACLLGSCQGQTWAKAGRLCP